MRHLDRRTVTAALTSLTVSALLGCGKNNNPNEGPAPASAQPATKSEDSGPLTLQGSGASFPAPLYSRWFKEFSSKNADIRVNYQSTGSGAGIKAFTEGQTDFGASDAAMSDEEIKAAKDNVVLLPVTAGHIVLAYNLPEIKDLKLSREAYAGIFLGEITKWNDPKIAASNPGVKLPDTAITPVNRSDGSGTTFVFTQHLSSVNPKWKEGPGTGKSVSWPAKTAIGGPKNDGVAALIQRTPGAIGYIEYVYAATSQQATALLENKAGKFVAPTPQAAAAALAHVELPDDLRAWVTDPAGDDAYPIATYTWILAKKKYDDKKKAEAVKKLLKWCLNEGQALAGSLHYLALPPTVVARVAKAVDTIE